ncbi:MAG TPA: AI-2E family transporter [Candidatus Saccharimonadales bacterium]|nr:AI-2E family transporter [Candidatus Saccharimonadales bacterium]
MFGFHRRNKDNEIWVNVSNRTLVRIILWVMAAFVAITAVHKGEHALLLIFTAFFLALALNAPVHWLALHLPGKQRGSRGIATFVSFLIVVIVLAGFLALIVPALVRDTHTFVESVPHLVQEARNKNDSFNKLISKYHLQNQASSLSNHITSRLHDLVGPAVSTLSSLAESVISVLVILVLTFMMLVEGPYWIGRFHELMSQEHSKRSQRLSADMYKVIRGYVNGQVLLAIIAALLITPALFILHISNPLALMVIIFLAALIPLFGHTIGAVIVTVVAFFHSPWSALIILAYYILYMQVENYIIQPRIQANTTNLSPLLVVLAVVIGVSFGGLFGGIIAIPVTGCLRVLVVDYLKSHGKLEEVHATSAPPTPDTI